MDQFTIAGTPYASRLLVGTGKYKDFTETRAAIDASGAAIVTVAIRRTNIGQDPSQPNLLDALPPSRFTILPNTAGCYTADDAVRTLRLARELLDGHPLCKLEVLGDPTNLFPNMPETLKAAETLAFWGWMALPRGVHTCSAVSGLDSPTPRNAPTESLGFPARKSHRSSSRPSSHRGGE